MSLFVSILTYAFVPTRNPRSDLIFKSLPRSVTLAAGLSWPLATSASNAEPAARAAADESKSRRERLAGIAGDSSKGLRWMASEAQPNKASSGHARITRKNAGPQPTSQRLI